ncbi:uncharacterized protein [Hetaerina americana]|uniref:uncharacterized protein isoform X2 n=1 Tax=Hetaerina americana TaxID=62018 RepID=UPI003A7F3375
MPLRRQPPSLIQASMAAIARHFDRICYAAATPKEMAELLETEEYLKVESPFTNLPAHLAEELSDAVKSTSPIRRHHLHALLSPATLQWTSSGVGDLLAAIDMLPQRCKMLAKIGEQCVHLLDLNLSSTPTTDRGVVMLCLASDGSARCQKLRRLCVSDTWVTSAGAAVALLALPVLREFDFERMFEVLRVLEAWSGRVGERVMAALGVSSSRRPLEPRPSLCLTTVTSSGELAGGAAEGPAATARLCPSATSVTVHATPLPSEALYPLMMLRHLTSLSLTTCPDEGDTMDFAQGVLPLLTAVGEQLTSLILSKFAYVDVGAIGKACPHLVNFALSEVTEFELMHQKICEEHFQELQALEIWADPDFILPANVLQQLLLFSKNMKNLLFKGVGILTDEMFRTIWKVNPMRHLSHLTLDHCHGITNATVHFILDADNELTMLRIWSCYRITKEAKNYITHRIMDENMDIYFDWFPVDE